MATAATTNQTALTVSPRTTASTPSAYAPASATASQARARTGASVHLAAARDGQRDAGHVLGAAEIDGRVGDLLGRLLALEVGEALHEVLEDAVLRHAGQRGQHGVQHLRPHRRLDVARAERVDGDVHRPELLGERLGERDDRGLGGAVGGEPAAARLPGDRRDGHDPPAAALPDTATSQPALARATAMARPRPRAAPVTRATLPSSSMVAVLTSRYRIASSPVMSRPTMSVCMSYVPW